MPSRWGTQTPFTNLTFDWRCPADPAEQIPYIGGEECPFSYGELQAEMDMINRALYRSDDGRRRARPGVHLPIPTYNITRDFPRDHPNAERLFAMTANHGLPTSRTS